MQTLILNISVITLNLIGLRAPVKDQRSSEWIRKTIAFYLSEGGILSQY